MSLSSCSFLFGNIEDRMIFRDPCDIPYMTDELIRIQVEEEINLAFKIIKEAKNILKYMPRMSEENEERFIDYYFLKRCCSRT